MYHFKTERLEIVLAGPSLTNKVLQFNIDNRQDLAWCEPTRYDDFYTALGVRAILKGNFRSALKGEEYRFYLLLKNTKKLIGTVDLNGILMGSVKTGSVAYKIDKDYRRQGYAGEAMRFLIDFAFNTVGLHRLEAMIMPKNTPSRALIESLGFQNEGVCVKSYEIAGKWEDHIRYALINDKIDPLADFK